MKLKSTAKFIYHLTLHRSKKMIIDRYGIPFWETFQKVSDEQFAFLINEFEEIGPSMFAFNYAYCPSYVAWYKAMEANKLDQHEKDILMLMMNERMLLSVPKPLLHLTGKMYLNNMRKGAQKHLQLQKRNQLHPDDWIVEFKDIDASHFDITIKECGFIKYAKRYHAEGILPAICQVDYMVSHYMHVGFERTMTLGSGKECCNGKYCLFGECAWNIEERLKENK